MGKEEEEGGYQGVVALVVGGEVGGSIFKEVGEVGDAREELVYYRRSLGGGGDLELGEEGFEF